MVDLKGETTEETDALLASLMLCETHADAFNAPLTWTFIDNRSRNREESSIESSIPVLSLAHSADSREGLEQESPSQEDEKKSANTLVRAEDMEDTPLLQRAFRSISG